MVITKSARRQPGIEVETVEQDVVPGEETRAGCGSPGPGMIGVHSPEFAFEKKRGNVVSGAERLGVTWPVALDSDLTTWDNYRNRFWLAKYLINAEGTVRYFRFGEGEYDQTGKMIRELLRQADPTLPLPEPTGRALDDLTTGRTPEIYLSSLRIRGYVGTPLLDGKTTSTIDVSGSPTLYRLTDDKDPLTARIELRLEEGLQAYACTVGWRAGPAYQTGRGEFVVARPIRPYGRLRTQNISDRTRFQSRREPPEGDASS